MKKNILYLSTLLFLILTSCNEVDDWTKFDIEYNKNVTIPASLGVDLPVNILTPPIPTDTESEFEVNNTAKKLIESIDLKTLKLTITSPSDADFSFLKSIEVYISADGLEEKKIAWKDDIPDNTKQITLEVSRDNLKEYIFKDDFTLKLKTVTDEILASDHKIDIHSVFFVDARILGI